MPRSMLMIRIRHATPLRLVRIPYDDTAALSSPHDARTDLL